MMFATEKLLPFLILGLFYTSIHTVTGLAAAWAGLGKSHWFWRVTAVGLVVGPWVAVEAWELVVMTFLQAVLAALSLRIVRGLRTRSRAITTRATGSEVPPGGTGWTFSITDVLLAMVSLAGVFAVAAKIETVFALVQDLALIAALHAAVTLSAVLASLPWKRRWVWAIWISAVCFAPVGGALALSQSWYDMPSISWGHFFPFALTTSGLTAAWALAMRYRGSFASEETAVPEVIHEPAGDRVRIGRYCLASLVIFSACVLAPAVILYCRAAFPPPIPATEMPNPNGYEDLVRAGSQLAHAAVPGSDATDSPTDELQDFHQRYENILIAARSALDLDCRVPLTFTDADIDTDAMSAFRQLGRAFDAEGRLAAEEGRLDDAAAWHVDVIRLGCAKAHGGLYVDELTGRAIEMEFGLKGLARLRAELSPQQRTELSRTLIDLEEHREPIDAVLRRELAWQKRASGWVGRLYAVLDEIAGGVAETRHFISMARDRRQTILSLLVVDLAIRDYQFDHRGLPESLQALVPNQLNKLPLDPFTGQPFVYHVTDGGFELYSLGPDGIDDGRAPFDRTTQLGDIVLDPPEGAD
jgi:hypothetical protein